MRVSEWMTRSVVTVTPETSISEAKRIMERRRIRHLPVVEKDRLVGIVTDRDIRLNLPSPATSLSVWEINYLLARLTVGEVMTKRPITVEAGKPVTDAAKLIIEHRIGALPVVDGETLVGIVTETDLLRAWVS